MARIEKVYSNYFGKNQPAQVQTPAQVAVPEYNVASELFDVLEEQNQTTQFRFDALSDTLASLQRQISATTPLLKTESETASSEEPEEKPNVFEDDFIIKWTRVLIVVLVVFLSMATLVLFWRAILASARK